MHRCMQFALSNAIEGREEEFRAWYASSHLMHTVRVPGIGAGQCFVRIDAPWPGGKHDNMMIWELNDPGYALDQLAQAKGTDRMPLNDAADMVTVQPPTMWVKAEFRSRVRQIGDRTGRSSCVLMLANPLEGQSMPFETTLLQGVLQTLSDLPGIAGATLLDLADEQIRGNARKYSHAILIELISEAEGIAALTPALQEIDYLDPSRWMALAFRPITPRVSTAQAILSAQFCRSGM